jgi:hypothetical protein
MVTFVGNNAAALLYLRSRRAKKGVPRVLLNPFGSQGIRNLASIHLDAGTNRLQCSKFQIAAAKVSNSQGLGGGEPRSGILQVIRTSTLGCLSKFIIPTEIKELTLSLHLPPFLSY